MGGNPVDFLGGREYWDIVGDYWVLREGVERYIQLFLQLTETRDVGKRFETVQDSAPPVFYVKGSNEDDPDVRSLS